MSELIVVKTETGQLDGLGEKGRRAYARFRKAVSGLEIGETLRLSWWQPRSPRFHRLFFAFLGQLFDMQEQFAEPDELRAWLTVGAGYCNFAPGPKGRMVALPKSIAWHAMDDAEFAELVLAVWQFMRTEHAQRFLWPTLSTTVTSESVERLLIGYDA